MTTLRIWHALLYLGDGAVLMPCALLLFAWLITAPASRRTAWWWLLAVLLMGGGAALSKVLYMVFGWHPAGWNFIGLSGHAAFSFLFFPSAAALVTSRSKTGLRVVVIALGGFLAFAISFASWVLRDHSLVEVVLGALWGALIAAGFLTITWRHVAKLPVPRTWMVASLLLLTIVAYKHQFPSTRVLGWVALQVSGHPSIHTRTELGPQAQLPMTGSDGQRTHSKAAHTRAPPRKSP